MKIFVTGADGILGSDFVAHASSQGHRVVRLSRRGGGQADETVVLRNMREVGPADLPGDCDAVVHFATGRDGDAEEVVRTSVEGTQRVFDAAIARKVPHFIHISSMSVYAKHPGREMERGPAELDPRPELRGAYAASKTLTERALYERTKASPPSHTALTILRPGLVFGPDLGGVLWETAARLPLGLVLGRGRSSQTVPLVHIADVSRAILGLLEQKPQPGTVKVYDVLSRAPRKADFLKLYTRLSGQPAHAIWPPRWLMVGLARLLDRVAPGQGAARREATVRQMYDWDVASLPASQLWEALGSAPQADAEAAIRATLTLDRDPAIRSEYAGLAQKRSRAILQAVNAPAPGPSVQGLLLVGAGRIATDMHMPAISALPQYRVHGVVELNDELANRAIERFPGARRYQGLSSVEPEAWPNLTAVIATPGASHFGLIDESLRLGGAVMVEKPLVLHGSDFTRLETLTAAGNARPLTVLQNYRLFPSTLKLWNFLASHDVGALVHAHVVYHGGRLSLAPARWMQEEKRHRVLLLDQAIHTMDIPFVLGGPLAEIKHVAVTDRRDGRATLSISGVGQLASGAQLQFDLSLAGTAQRRLITLEFERCVCQLSWYPDGFRVLPVKSNPIDDIAFGVAQLAQYGRERLLWRKAAVRPSFAPHFHLYRHHLNRLARGPDPHDPFSIHGVKDTMVSLLTLADEVYP